MNSLIGRVKWFNDAKGFGFIQQEKGPDIFVHFTAIEVAPGNFRSLSEGQTVSFKTLKDKMGLQAHDVRVIDSSHSIMDKVNSPIGLTPKPKKNKCPNCGFHLGGASL